MPSKRKPTTSSKRDAKAKKRKEESEEEDSDSDAQEDDEQSEDEASEEEASDQEASEEDESSSEDESDENSGQSSDENDSKTRSSNRKRKAPPPPKKRSQKAKKQPPSKSIFTAKQKAEMKQVSEDVAGNTIVDLKAMLRENNQPVTGVKKELIKRVSMAKVLGALQKCPKCFGGNLHLDEKTGKYKCKGYMDDDVFKNCSFKGTEASVQRVPWTDV